MAIFHVKDSGGRLVGVVRHPQNDESAVREMMAGRGKDRDEAGAAKPAAAATEEAPVAGQEPDNRGRK